MFDCGLPPWLWALAILAAAIVLCAGVVYVVGLVVRKRIHRKYRRKPPCQPELLR